MTDFYAKWIGLIGGTLGLLGAIGAAAVAVMQYFATHEQLRTVDCWQYYKTEMMEAQTVQLIYKDIYETRRLDALQAQFASDQDADNLEKRVAYQIAVERQNEAAMILKEAQDSGKAAQEEIETCDISAQTTSFDPRACGAGLPRAGRGWQNHVVGHDRWRAGHDHHRTARADHLRPQGIGPCPFAARPVLALGEAGDRAFT